MQATVASPQQVAELLGLLTMHINRTASPELFRELSELGLSFTQLKVMFQLESEDELSVKDLADRLAMSLAAMSRSVDGLVREGYVARRESATDRRSRLVGLLPAGREALGRVLAARHGAVLAFASGLTDAERNALRDALLPVTERISSP